jgi:hypothetical protein
MLCTLTCLDNHAVPQAPESYLFRQDRELPHFRTTVTQYLNEHFARCGLVKMAPFCDILHHLIWCSLTFLCGDMSKRHHGSDQVSDLPDLCHTDHRCSSVFNCRGVKKCLDRQSIGLTSVTPQGSICVCQGYWHNKNIWRVFTLSTSNSLHVSLLGVKLLLLFRSCVHFGHFVCRCHLNAQWPVSIPVTSPHCFLSLGSLFIGPSIKSSECLLPSVAVWCLECFSPRQSLSLSLPTNDETNSWFGILEQTTLPMQGIYIPIIPNPTITRDPRLRNFVLARQDMHCPLTFPGQLQHHNHIVYSYSKPHYTHIFSTRLTHAHLYLIEISVIVTIPTYLTKHVCEFGYCHYSKK